MYKSNYFVINFNFVLVFNVKLIQIYK